MIIKWSNDYSVGNSLIDDHHKQIIQILNSLYEAVRKGTEKEVIPKILDALTAYSRYHFCIEEGMFLVTNYPDSEMHIYEHDEFRNNLVRLKNVLDENKMMLGLNLMEFLNSWFIQHILKIDMQIMPYLDGNKSIDGNKE